jgi:hypothetical protein
MDYIRTLRRYTETLDLDGIPVRAVSLEGLLLTKQTMRDKDAAGRIEAIQRRSRTACGSPTIPQSWLTITMSGNAGQRPRSVCALARNPLLPLRIVTAQVALPQCTDTPHVRCQCLGFLHSDSSWKSRA